MFRFIYFLFIIVSISSCTITGGFTWNDVVVEDSPLITSPVQIREGSNQYVLYDYVSVEPGRPLLNPPIRTDVGGMYDEEELEVYVHTVIKYHDYIERYVKRMGVEYAELDNDISGNGCVAGDLIIPVLGKPPGRPVPPTGSTIGQADGNTLLIEYLHRFDIWLLDYGKYFKASVGLYENTIREYKAKCY